MDPTFTRAFTQADGVVFRISGNVALAMNDNGKTFYIDIGVFYPFVCLGVRRSDGGHRAGYLGLSGTRPLRFEGYLGVGKGQWFMRRDSSYPGPETFLVADPPKGRAFACRSPLPFRKAVPTQSRTARVSTFRVCVVLEVGRTGPRR